MEYRPMAGPNEWGFMLTFVSHLYNEPNMFIIEPTLVQCHIVDPENPYFIHKNKWDVFWSQY